MAANNGSEIRVRMAPSPTGFVHLGTVRTALFNWLFARHNKGVFVLRIEDTDKDRSLPEHEKSLIEAFHWLGLEWDEGPDVDSAGNLISKGDYAPYRQSERTDLYASYIRKMLSSGHAYYCYCSKDELEAQRQSMEAAGLPPKYSGKCRDLTSPPEGREPEVIRFRTPETKVKFNDLIRGSVEFDSALFGDIVMAKDENTPLYNFANVIDDFEMKITHVVRGEEHLSNTPKQILMARALDFPEIKYAHIPLILNPDRSKLSKRTNKASFLDYRDEGYLPEAMINFLALLGWHSSGDKEIFSKEELVEEFDIKRVQKAGAIFNPEKLSWFNAQYIKSLPIDILYEKVKPFLEQKGLVTDKDFVLRVLHVEQERMRALADITTSGEFYFKLSDYDPLLLRWKESHPSIIKDVLNSSADIITEEKEILADKLSVALNPLIERYGRGEVLWPLRVALSGLKASPDPLVIAEVLGKEETIKRIKMAISKLGQA